jgi:hypothetical protein
MDAGWDIAGWLFRHSSLSHPFSSYLFTYEENIQRLRATLTATAV